MHIKAQHVAWRKCSKLRHFLSSCCDWWIIVYYYITMTQLSSVHYLHRCMWLAPTEAAKWLEDVKEVTEVIREGNKWEIKGEKLTEKGESEQDCYDSGGSEAQRWRGPVYVTVCLSPRHEGERRESERTGTHSKTPAEWSRSPDLEYFLQASPARRDRAE